MTQLTIKTQKAMENISSKTKVYNVIIMDRSGSMWDIQKSAINGFNEVLGGVKADAKTYAETQEHYMTLVLFDSTSIDNVHWNENPEKASILTAETYVPGACTPLYDAIGKTLTKLEKELAVMLFERQGKQTKLTEAGEKFLFHVDRVLREMEVARQEIIMDHGGEGSVSVSFLHSLGDTYLPLILSRFHIRYPHIGITLNQQNSTALTEALMKGDTDICLCSMLNGADIAWMYLWSEELFLVVPCSHPLAQKEKVRLEEIDGEAFITLKPEYTLRQQVNQLLDLAESQPQVIFEGDEVHNLISLVAAQLGVSLLPHIPCTEQMGVCYIPVAFPVCKRAVGIAWNTRRPLTSAAICFQQFTINYFNSHQDV